MNPTPSVSGQTKGKLYSHWKPTILEDAWPNLCICIICEWELIFTTTALSVYTVVDLCVSTLVWTQQLMSVVMGETIVHIDIYSGPQHSKLPQHSHMCDTHDNTLSTLDHNCSVNGSNCVCTSRLWTQQWIHNMLLVDKFDYIQCNHT